MCTSLLRQSQFDAKPDSLAVGLAGCIEIASGALGWPNLVRARQARWRNHLSKAGQRAAKAFSPFAMLDDLPPEDWRFIRYSSCRSAQLRARYCSWASSIRMAPSLDASGRRSQQEPVSVGAQARRILAFPWVSKPCESSRSERPEPQSPQASAAIRGSKAAHSVRA
jgi:hypothetical protein